MEKKVPEIRFKEFNGEWVGNYLGGLAEIVRGASPRPIEDPKWFDRNSSVGWLRIRDVTEQDGRIRYLEQRISKLGQEKTRVLFDQSLLLSIAASVGKPVINYVETGVHDGFLIFKKPLFNLEFMYQWLKSFELNWQQYGQPGSQVNLNSDIVKSQIVFMPLKKEQTQIGNTFQKLDSLINQHQQQHDQLSNIKKAMLEKMFPKLGETLPEIRFKGFSGEWEVRALGDYTTFRRGSFPQPYGNKEWYGGECAMPFVQVVDVSKELSLVEDTKQKISIKAQSRSVFVKKGSVVVTLQGTIGRVAITQYDSFVDRTILIFESFVKKTDSSFWAYTIQNKFDLEKRRAPGGTIKTITKEALSSFDVLIPSTEEQTQIGNYFQKLDALINQHQQQINKLNNIKQSFLSKMFV